MAFDLNKVANCLYGSRPWLGQFIEFMGIFDTNLSSYNTQQGYSRLRG